MEVMGVVAVMVNLALLGMGGSVQRMFPNMTVTDRIILIVVLEVILIYFGVNASGWQGKTDCRAFFRYAELLY